MNSHNKKKQKTINLDKTLNKYIGKDIAPAKTSVAKESLDQIRFALKKFKSVPQSN